MSESNIIITRHYNWLFWSLLAVFLSIILICSITKQFDKDEIEAIHTTWKIFDGEKIYVDFFQHHHPLYYYLLMPVLLICGQSITSIYVMRLVSFIMLALMLLVTYRLSLKTSNNKNTARLSVLLLSTALLFVNSAIEIRPDVPQTLFSLISILTLISYLEKKQLPLLVISAICLAVSFLFLQKSVFTVLLIAILLLTNVYKKNITFKAVFLYGLIALISLVPYCFYLFYSGTFSAYWTFNWGLNMKFLRHFTAFNSLGIALRTSTILCVFYVWSLLKFTKTPTQIRIGWLSLGFIASTFLVRAPYEQYFMIIVPLMAVVASNAIIRLFEKKPVCMILVLILGVLLPSKLSHFF